MGVANELKNILKSCIGAKDFNLIVALKLERVTSNIKFLKQCKRQKVIPKGLTVANKLKDTISSNNHRIDSLIRRQSFQWISLIIDLLYHGKAEISTHCIHPLPRDSYSSLS